MPKTMTLTSRCSRCRFAVELRFVPWAGSGAATAADWACPECQAANQMPAIGEVTQVSAAASRGEPAVPDRTH